MTTLIEFLTFLQEQGIEWWSFETMVAGAAYARSKKGHPPRAEFRIPDDIGLEKLFDYSYILVGINREQLFKKYPKIEDLEKAISEWKKKNKPPEQKMCIYFMNDASMARNIVDEIDDEDVVAIADGEKFICTNGISENYGVCKMGTCDN